jgi:hypothetical protein
MKFSSTNKSTDHRLRILLHGPSGSGKTWLTRTLPDLSRVLLVATEPGTLSLGDVDIPMVTLDAPGELADVCRGLLGKADKYDWLVVDSLSAWADAVLAEELPRHQHGLKAYGALQDRVMAMVRGPLRDIPQHLLCTARQERVVLDGTQVLVPGLPGQTLTHKHPIAHEFDAVWCLWALKEGEQSRRLLQTDSAADPRATAKTRDPWGRIKPWEQPNLADLTGRLLASQPQAEVPAEPEVV